MELLIDQLKKLATFLVLLCILLLVNLIFNLNYKWEGISLIVRVYTFLISFFLIFNFSTIDIDAEKDKYRQRWGRKGLLLLFFITRIVPFMMIYLVTIIFTLIDYVGAEGWPGVPMLVLLSGGYANTVIYSLMLLMILKMKRDPQVTIPLFLAASVFYLLVLDKLVYIYFAKGVAVSFIKITKYTLFVFFLLFC